MFNFFKNIDCNGHNYDWRFILSILYFFIDIIYEHYSEKI